ncbi:transposase [Paucidesulfovibrio longus]|uniref:transposase n=1 Tax=Paucidesulfovibrio longus TaxID=889 RepID=UPI0003B4B34D|nr:transposase [Paucidesulfovibrio longus]
MNRCDLPAFTALPPDYEALVEDEDRAREHLLKRCWPDGEPECPRCRVRRIYSLSGGRLRCSACKYTFQPFSGRWINNGALSCTEWLKLTERFVRELSPHQIKEELGLSYNTVYKALTALRFAILAHSADAAQLLGPETGLDSYLKGNRLTGGPKQMRQDTIPVFGLLRKDDLVFIDLMPGFQAETVFHFHLNFHLKLQRAGNLVYTDRYRDYAALVFCGNESLPYGIIRRSDEPPFIDASQDEFWCMAKERLRSFRGISCQRFALYLKELEFRFNNRTRPIFDQLLGFLCDLV